MKSAALRFVAAVAAGWASAATVAQPMPVGSEFQINTHTANIQHLPSVATDGDGDFVVAWTSYLQDGSSFGIFARRFDSSGVAAAAEFQVNTHTVSNQYGPSIAMDGDGDFIVAWTSYAQDGYSFGVFARRFNSSGASSGIEFQVNTYTTYRQYQPSVGMGDDGAFVVAWSSDGQDGFSYGVFARRFDSSGVGQGVELQVNSFTLYSQHRPSVAMDDDRDFVVAWSSYPQNGPSHGVFVQRFDSSGVPQGGEFQVDSISYHQFESSVATDSDGGFVVAWEGVSQVFSSEGVFARQFDSSGASLGGEFRVNSRTTSSQYQPSVAMDGSGDFVVTWQDSPPDGSTFGVFARGFDAAGAPRSGELQVNSHTNSYQSLPSVAMDSDGDFVVAWQSYAQDGSSVGVFAQRFAGGGQVPIVVTIDIKPGAFPNKINVQSNGLVEVAILTTSVADGDAVDFDAWDVDPPTVRFGPAAAAPHGSAHAQDVDGEGDLDMTLRFRIPDTGVPCGATEATLTGETFAAQAIEGTDAIVTTGCN